MNLRSAFSTLCLLCFCAVDTARAFHVVIDPGHGGSDTGATRGRLLESEISLDIARHLRERLRNQEGLRVSMTREEDVGLGLQERLDRATAVGADLFVSLHANAAPDNKARGVEIFIRSSDPPDETGQDTEVIIEDLRRSGRLRSSLVLSEILRENMDPTPTGKLPSIKQAPLFVVNRASMPAVLIEVGFLTHPEEARHLKSADHRRNIAEKIERSILAYRERFESTTGPSGRDR